jgi:hypothetical protein
MTDYAKSELDILGMTDEDVTGEDVNFCMREHLLRMVEEFSKEGHSGYSASYAIGLLEKLLSFKPLTPLTGEDSEWMEVYHDDNGRPVHQNKRMSTIFKSETEGAYDIDGIVFYDWYTDDVTGVPVKSYYTSFDSRVSVEFPYTPPDQPIYKERISKEEE